MAQVNITDSEVQLAALAERAATGEEIVLTRAGLPIARIVPLAKRAIPASREPRKPGVARHWVIDNDALIAPTDPEDLDAAEGLHTDEFGITRREPA